MNARSTPLTGGFSRRGACPALSAPMRTGDGLLVRLNPVAGRLSPAQLAGLCDAADIHGNGIIEVTARGSIQIRGLTEGSAPLFAQAVDRLRISVRTGVPVQTGVLAGLDPQEIANPIGLADMIRTGIADAGLEGLLGPKVSVVVDGGGLSALDEVSADVRLTAMDSAGWQVAIAGDAHTARALGLAADDSEACQAALGLLSDLAAMGREARARDLNTGSLPARTSTLAVADPRDKPEDEGSSGSSLIGTTDLRNNQVALGVALPFGHATANAMKIFAESAASIDIDDIRPAPGRALMAICRTRDAAQILSGTAETLDFVTTPNDRRLSISACPGAPGCASGHIPSRQMAAEIANDLSSLFDGSVHLHVSGCAKGCAHPAKATLTLVGSAAGTGLILNGTARDVPLAFSNSDSAGRAFANLGKRVATQRQDNETMAQAVQRIGVSALADAFGQGSR